AAFRKQAEHFVKSHFPQSNVVVSDASGQQLLNTAVPTGTPLPRYVRMDALRRVFEKGDPQISNLLFGPVLHRNIAVVDVPVWRDSKVAYDLAASLPLSIFFDIIMRQRPNPDWKSDGDARRPTNCSLSRAGLMNRFEGAFDTTTFDGTVVLS